MRRKGLTDDIREKIRAELEESRRDRAEGSPHPKPPKAEVFARAIEALDHGALEVKVENAVWRVIGEPRPPQYITIERDREQIMAELEDGRRTRAGTDALAAFEDAVVAIQAGALAVFVGGAMYRVVER